jgi:hypothetical protein
LVGHISLSLVVSDRSDRIRAAVIGRIFRVRIGSVKRFTDGAKFGGVCGAFPAGVGQPKVAEPKGSRPVLALRSNRLFQRQRIPTRIPAAVVVEAREHIPAHGLPLPDAIRPPAEVVIAVRARVEIMMVRSMQPDVDEWRSHPKNAGELRAADARRQLNLPHRDN